MRRIPTDSSLDIRISRRMQEYVERHEGQCEACVEVKAEA
jgi:hypothetical protein